jgi:Raf kinase inhibitor-like YbhB/YbcL family protein
MHQRRQLWRFEVYLVAGLLVMGCKPSTSQTTDEPTQTVIDNREGDAIMSLEVQCAAFGPGEAIPKKHTEDGQDVSPALSWSGVPEGTRELALICDDPDAPRPEPWVHWVIYKIPAGTTGLPENVPTKETLDQPPGAMQGKNSWNTIGYRGPAPPRGHGVHHDHFKVHALDKELDVQPGLSKNELLAAMQGHILATGEIIGTYER